jgi:hypothetical protein
MSIGEGVEKKVKQSHCRLGEALKLRLPDFMTIGT